MKQTNPKALRAEMKDYLELAEKEPLRIQRRSGGSFILINEDQFQQMQSEIVSLQRRLLGMSQVVAGEGKEYTPGNRSRLNRLKKKASAVG